MQKFKSSELFSDLVTFFGNLMIFAEKSVAALRLVVVVQRWPTVLVTVGLGHGLIQKIVYFKWWSTCRKV